MPNEPRFHPVYKVDQQATHDLGSGTAAILPGPHHGRRDIQSIWKPSEWTGHVRRPLFARPVGHGGRWADPSHLAQLISF